MQASPAVLSTPDAITDYLISLLEERGTGDYIGESISQLEHSLQCAHYGLQAGSPDETIIAALFHDIGQFLPVEETRDVSMAIGNKSVGRVSHEKIGEEYLRRLGFAESVCRLVGSHVSAKRYLTAVDSSYYYGLSDASKNSLAFQGGPFKGKQLESFESDPMKDDMVKVRRWDDMSKVVGVVEQTPRASTYRGMIRRHLGGQGQRQHVHV